MKMSGWILLFALGTSAYASQGPADGDADRVELSGKLHARQAAIGSETTGVTLRASDGTSYELLVKDRDLAKRLDGRDVKVSGRLKISRGVETPVRRIVDVGTLEGK